MSFITFVFQYAYAQLTFDLDLVSESHRAGFLSADVGKTINRVLKTHLLQKTHFRRKVWIRSLDVKPFD